MKFVLDHVPCLSCVVEYRCQNSIESEINPLNCQLIAPNWVVRERTPRRRYCKPVKLAQDISCEYCGGKNLVRLGTRVNSDHRKLILRCSDCNKRFSIRIKEIEE